MKRVALATVLLSAIALTSARAQPRSIGGRVLADDTGDPIVNARVSLVTTGQAAPMVLTDHEGRFTLAAPSARVTIAASKSGYGRHEAAASATDQSIEIRLSRGAVISGRIVDQFGDPLVAANIAVEQAEKPLTSGFTNSGAAASSFTDDRGEYRVGGLAAGSYLVGVVTMGAPVRQSMPGGGVAMIPSPVRTYYPGTETRNKGEALQLQTGEERPSTDFVVARVPFAGFLAGSPLAPPRAVVAPNTPAGVIRGRVVTTDGRALAGADVLMLSTTRFQQTLGARSGDDGRFEFREIAAGSFRIFAQKAGFSAPGTAMTPGLPPMESAVTVDLAEGETKEKADITLARWGSIEGHVSDELGDPLQGATVQLLQIRYQGGRRRLVGAGSAPRLTDDLGRFRTYGLPPGRYVVSATVGDVATAELPGYTRTYFPGTPNASEAQFVSVGLSQEIGGVDFSLTRARTALVAGTLLDAAGSPSAAGSVRLIPSSRSAVTAVSVGARLMAEGRFEFPNVPPGQYVIQVDRGRRGSAIEGEFGALPISVDGADITGLQLQTSAGSSIEGRVVFDSYFGAKPPARSGLEVTPVPVDPDQATASPASADIRDDWSFIVAGVNGPRRLQLLRVPAGWALKEIRARGVEVTDQTLAFGRTDQSLSDVEIVLTDRRNELSGAIVDDRARPAPGSHVIVFAADRDRWYPRSRFLRETTAGADGAIALDGVPPGSYYAAAVPKLPADGPDAWQDPVFLESLAARALAFALGEGQKQILNLKLP